MDQHTPPADWQLDQIAATAAHLYGYGQPGDAAWEILAETDVPRLVAEVRRQRAELAEMRAERDRYRAAWQSARFRAQAYGEGILRVVEDRDAYQGWLKQAEARIRELERPAVEAQRNEIRQSFAELAAAARETRDHEGAFEVECRLRDREEQWKREDAAAEDGHTS